MLKEVERKHEKMYRAHNALTCGAALLHEVASGVYAECRHPDSRAKFSEIVKQIEEARDMADRAWKMASEARTSLIQQTGCNGTCSDASRQPVQLKSAT